MKERPIIAVTGPDRGGWPAWACTSLAIGRAGGRAIRLRPRRYPGNAPLPEFDGLVLGGGADVDPARYGEELKAYFHEKDSDALKNLRGRLLSMVLAPVLFVIRGLFALTHAGVDRERDVLEQRCLETALAHDLPVLGICRGAQFINIHLGGTLHPDVTGFYGEAGKMRTVYPRNPVHIEPDSRLHQLLDARHVHVNSLHRQAVKVLGEGLKITARDDAGIVQAIEHDQRDYLIGVQWHPEYLPAIHTQQKFFRELVHHARRRSAHPARSQSE